MSTLDAAVSELQHTALQAMQAQMKNAGEAMKQATVEIISLRRQNDALLDACKAALPLLEGFADADFAAEDGDEPIVQPVIAQVQAAIAMAESL